MKLIQNLLLRRLVIIIEPSDNIMEYAAGQYEDPRFQLGKHEWPALLRLLDDNKSIYNQ